MTPRSWIIVVIVLENNCDKEPLLANTDFCIESKLSSKMTRNDQRFWPLRTAWSKKVLRSFVCKWVIEWNRLDKNFIGFYESNLPLANQFCQKPVKKPGTDFYFVEPRYFREFCMHPLTFDSPKNKYKHKKVSENVSPMESFSNENSLVKLLKNESHVKSN